MLASNLLGFILTTVLTALILAGKVQLWMLFLISFLFGTVDAFFLPAQMSLIPFLVRSDELQAGNALFQMTAQLSQFVGPALAATHFTQGATALGTIISAFGAGSLIGAGLSGTLRPRHVGLVTLLTIVVAGVGLAGLGLVSNLAGAALVALATGIGVGYTNVLLISSLQKRITPELRGRVMSIMLLGSIGANPLSNALAGALVDINMQGLFLGVGLLLAALGLVALSLPYVRKLSKELA